jgi:putative nucleotidyltransferase with HDIG domain
MIKKMVQEILSIDKNLIDRFVQIFPNGNIYLVGGSVRDLILKRQSSDIDLVVEGVSPDELLGFLKKNGQVVSIAGRAFGVYKFKSKSGAIYDIALPRQEKYLTGQRKKHAQVNFEVLTISDDLARRDFTINAMAILLNSKLETRNSKQIRNNNDTISKQISDFPLVDPYDGLDDLKNKIIRAVGNPNERFNEDPTRILRGIRFACQFDFEIEKNTSEAMKRHSDEITKLFKDENGHKVQRVSDEMIGQEIIKTFNVKPDEALDYWDKTGLLELLLPEVAAMKGIEQPKIYHSEGDVYIHTKMVLSNLPSEAFIATKIAALFHDIGKPLTFRSAKETGDRIRFSNHAIVGAKKAEAIGRKYHFNKNLINEIVWLIENHGLFHDFPKMRKEKQKKIARNENLNDLIVLMKADRSATIHLDKLKPDFSPLNHSLKIIAKILEEDQHKPRQIISGDEIIRIMKQNKIEYDTKLHGPFVGSLKKKINTLYDRDKIRTKNEAYEIVVKMAQGQIKAD